MFVLIDFPPKIVNKTQNCSLLGSSRNARGGALRDELTAALETNETDKLRNIEIAKLFWCLFFTC